MVKFNEQDVTYLNSLNSAPLPEESRIGLTSKHGYVMNLTRDKLERLEAIYKQSFDERFHLCYHCGADVFQMVRKLYEALEKQTAQVEPELEWVPGEPKKSAKRK